MPWHFVSPPRAVTAPDNARISLLPGHGLALQTLVEGKLSLVVTGFPPMARGCARPLSAYGLRNI